MRENYQKLMREFAYSIEYLRERTGNQFEANMAINQCAQRANATLTDAIRTYFYPTFSIVQSSTSIIPLITLDTLTRGNLFNDADEMLEYVNLQYDAFVLQWLQTVSKFFRWEKEKVDVVGDFYIEEMNLCLCEAVSDSSLCMEMPGPRSY